MFYETGMMRACCNYMCVFVINHICCSEPQLLLLLEAFRSESPPQRAYSESTIGLLAFDAKTVHNFYVFCVLFDKLQRVYGTNFRLKNMFD